MNYAQPEHERSAVNQAGNLLRQFFTGGAHSGDPESIADALHVIDNWRAAHQFPLNSFTMTLRNRARRLHATAKTPQRIKRLPSIAAKLLDKKDMKLTQMQDIGGCRAVLPTLAQVGALRQMYAREDLVHTFTGEKDYIAEPKSSGYRGIHLKYRFAGSAKSMPYDGLKIEIQMRTLLQHRWATAVEAAGTFNEQALKASKGSPEWLRFFALMSSVFAAREGCPAVPGTPESIDETFEEIRHLNARHHIASTFSQYHALLPQIEQARGAKYFIVVLDPVAQTVHVRGRRKDQAQEASREYTQIEASLPPDSPTQVVLVSVGSVAGLKRAYPNYFLDTADFLKEVRSIVGA